MGGGRERAATRSAGESLPHIIITNNQWEQDREMLFMSSAPKKKKKKTIVACMQMRTSCKPASEFSAFCNIWLPCYHEWRGPYRVGGKFIPTARFNKYDSFEMNSYIQSK